jgi:hypothetical protein
MARNESLKLEIRESESLRILKLRIRESGFANPNLKDSYRGFVSEKKNSQITRFVSFRKDSYTNPASLISIKVAPTRTNLTIKKGANPFFYFSHLHRNDLFCKISCLHAEFEIS